MTDQPEFADMNVSNGSALTAALTEPALDAAYQAAFDITLDIELPSSEANYTLAARRTDAVIRTGKQNAFDVNDAGLFARKFITGDQLGSDPSTVGDRVTALGGSDRMFYTTLGWKVTIPDIATRGVAGGIGFTANGVITVRPDGPLATICSIFPPETNPGQDVNGLIDSFFAVDTFGFVVNRLIYQNFKASGVCAPRLDKVVGSIYQSGVTSSQISGKTEIKRRKMTDFILDTFSELLPPFVKKLNKQTERDNIRGTVEGFLEGLLSAQNPLLARIEGFVVRDGSPPNSADLRALGVHKLEVVVRLLGSLDNIVIQAEIGENAILVTEVAA